LYQWQFEQNSPKWGMVDVMGLGGGKNCNFRDGYTALTVYLLLAYQKFLNRFSLSIQQLCQLIQLNLLGARSLEELLNPKRRKFENSCYLNLLSLLA